MSTSATSISSVHTERSTCDRRIAAAEPILWGAKTRCLPREIADLQEGRCIWHPTPTLNGYREIVEDERLNRALNRIESRRGWELPYGNPC